METLNLSATANFRSVTFKTPFVSVASFEDCQESRCFAALNSPKNEIHRTLRDQSMSAATRRDVI